MRGLLQDFRDAARHMWQAPAFTLTGVLTLGIGIGAATAMFSVVDGVLLRQLQYPNPDELLLIRERRDGGAAPTAVSMPEFLAWRAQPGPLQGLAAFMTDTVTVVGAEPERVDAARVSAGFFDLLGVTLVAGRDFRDEDERASALVCVVTEDVWAQYFGAAPLGGQALTVDGRQVEVVGIVRRSSGFPEAARLWLPMPFQTATPVPSLHFLSVLGRGNSASRELAATHLASVNTRLSRELPSLEGHGVAVVPLREAIVGGVERSLLVMFAAIILLVALACCSVATMLLARAATREGEIALRAAFGATPWRLVRHFAAEGVVWAGGAVLIGLATAFGALRVLLILHPEGLPRVANVSIDARVAVFAIAGAVLAVGLASLLPALHISRLDVSHSLEGGSRGVIARARRHRAQRVLVAGQVALASILLAGMVLMLESFLHLRAIPLGFVPGNVLTVRVDLPAVTAPNAARVAQFHEHLLSRLHELPGTVGVAGAVGLPLSGGASRTVRGAALAEPLRVSANIVTPGYFRTMGIPITAGRDFTPDEMHAASPVVAVNRTLATQLFGTGEAVGRRIQFDDAFGNEAVTIIAVVGDVRQSLLADVPAPEVYSSRLGSPRMTLVLRSGLPPGAATPAIRAAVREIDAGVPVSVRPMTDVVAQPMGQPRFRAVLMTAFAGAALLIAAAGLLGLVAYRVAERRVEFGIRAAVGARPWDILSVVLKEELRWVVLGIGVGLAGSVAATTFLASLLYGVRPGDFGTFVAVTAILLGVSTLAVYLPARRAIRSVYTEARVW